MPQSAITLLRLEDCGILERAMALTGIRTWTGAGTKLGQDESRGKGKDGDEDDDIDGLSIGCIGAHMSAPWLLVSWLEKNLNSAVL